MITLRIALVTGLVALALGCNSAGAGGDGSAAELTAKDQIARINPAQPAQVPQSLENAKGGDVAPTSMRIMSTPVDTSGEKGVFGRIMQDLMYNWLLDLVESPMETSNARLFLALLKDIAEDPSVPFALNTEIDLGVRPFPAETSGPDGETEMDWGTMLVTEVSSSEKVVHWSVPYGTGVYYIRLDVIQIDGDTLRFETRLGYKPDGQPMQDAFMEAIDTDGGVFSFAWQGSENQIFEQYIDSNGMLRTFFNTTVEDNVDLLFLMIGDDTGAAIDAYQLDKTGDFPVRRSFEAYNQAGSLIGQIFYDQPLPYRYPLKYVTRSGYTLTTDGTDYWLDSDSDGNNTFDDGSEINLTSGAGVVEDYVYDESDFDPDRPWDVGEYSTWDSGKKFDGEGITLLKTNTELSELDSASQIAALDALLSDWLNDFSSDIDIANRDIITFPTDKAGFLAAVELPLNPADFPTP